MLCYTPAVLEGVTLTRTFLRSDNLNEEAPIPGSPPIKTEDEEMMPANQPVLQQIQPTTSANPPSFQQMHHVSTVGPPGSSPVQPAFNPVIATTQQQIQPTTAATATAPLNHQQLRVKNAELKSKSYICDFVPLTGTTMPHRPSDSPLFTPAAPPHLNSTQTKKYNAQYKSKIKTPSTKAQP